MNNNVNGKTQLWKQSKSYLNRNKLTHLNDRTKKKIKLSSVKAIKIEQPKAKGASILPFLTSNKYI